MRAHLHAGRLFAAQAQVALRGELDLLLQDGVAIRDVDDVAPGAAPRAVAAADAGRGVDRDFRRADRARDGARRAADHAGRVGALIAGRGHQPVPELETLADESRDSSVRVGARPHAVVAARAGLEVDQQHALAVDEPRVHRHLQIFGLRGVPDSGASLLQALDRHFPELLFDVLMLFDEPIEVRSGHLDRTQLDALDRGEREGPRLLEQNRGLSEVVALAQVRQREIGRARYAPILSRNLRARDRRHPPERLARRSAPRDRRKRARPVPSGLGGTGRCTARRGRHYAEMRSERPLPVAPVHEFLELRCGALKNPQRRSPDHQALCVRARAHRCRHRIAGERGHLAEDLSRVEENRFSQFELGGNIGKDDRRRAVFHGPAKPFSLRSSRAGNGARKLRRFRRLSSLCRRRSLLKARAAASAAPRRPRSRCSTRRRSTRPPAE